MISRFTFLLFFISLINILTPLQGSAFAARGGEVEASCCEHHGEEENPPVFHRCGSTLYRQLEEQRWPALPGIRQELEHRTQQWIEQNSQQLKHADELIIIPVVVHVVYNQNQPEQNISYQQIVSQIEALNRDFRRWNADTLNTPSIFKNLAADTRIEFQLAQRTPEGLPTNGITRTPTNIASFSMDADNVKFNNTGGKSIWNRDRYLNLWVCSLESDYLGYAQYPGGRADTDGIVISYRNFGTLGTAQFPYNQGRTLTHEVGHWFNLVHVWGDEDQCGVTDYVQDTPDQETAYYHCPDFPQITCDSEDMFMNYMDYTDDRCMNLFTVGQTNRMHATLNGFRISLKSSDALLPPLEHILACDTLNKTLLNAELTLYTATEGGYATGNNVYGDKAKAQYFENQEKADWIRGAGFAFGAINDNGGMATLALWAADFNRKPLHPPLLQMNLPLSSLVADVQNNAISWINFDTPLQITGPFFIGVILPNQPGDTLALLAATATNKVDAWEQWSDNTWANFQDSWAGTLDVNLAVFPVSCHQTPQSDDAERFSLTLGPNPNTGQMLNFYFSQHKPDEIVSIEIFDITGRRVLHKGNMPLNSFIPLNISNISNQGIFLVRVSNKNLSARAKLLIMHNH